MPLLLIIFQQLVFYKNSFCLCLFLIVHYKKFRHLVLAADNHDKAVVLQLWIEKKTAAALRK